MALLISNVCFRACSLKLPASVCVSAPALRCSALPAGVITAEVAVVVFVLLRKKKHKHNSLAAKVPVEVLYLTVEVVVYSAGPCEHPRGLLACSVFQCEVSMDMRGSHREIHSRHSLLCNCTLYLILPVLCG